MTRKLMKAMNFDVNSLTGFRRATLRLSARHRTARGVTLFEVLIVVAILAMVAGGVAVFALPKFRDAQKSNAETGARVIRTAVQSWQASSGESGCPTMTQLVQDKQLDPGANSNDPWGQPYALACSEDDVTVTSAGPDKKKNTKDDISVPKGATAGEGEQP
jgi:general secretion pathway protein G